MEDERKITEEYRKLIDDINAKGFADADDALKYAQYEAKGSRLAVYAALAGAYRFYNLGKDISDYLKDKFNSHDPKISYKDGDNLFPPIVRLVFGLTDPKYRSRVSEYSLALEYVHRKIHEDQKLADEIDNPGIVVTILSDVGGIKSAVEAQRKYNRPVIEGVANQNEINEFLSSQYKSVFSKRKPITSFTTNTQTEEGEFVIMMGRVGARGQVDVVEMIDIGSDTDRVLSIIDHQDLIDRSTTSEEMSLFAGTLGFLKLFDAKKNPVVRISNETKSINISANRDHLASVVITVHPKKQEFWNTYLNDTYMPSEAYRWFEKYAQNLVSRTFYDLENHQSTNGEYDLLLKNKINNEQKRLSLKLLTEQVSKQVVLDDRLLGNWPFSFNIERHVLVEIYETWLKEWPVTSPSERKKASGRVISLLFTPDEVQISSPGSDNKGIIIQTMSQTLTSKNAQTETNVLKTDKIICPNLFRGRGGY